MFLIKNAYRTSTSPMLASECFPNNKKMKIQRENKYENRDISRIFQPQDGVKFKHTEPRRKIIGSYKKEFTYIKKGSIFVSFITNQMLQ